MNENWDGVKWESDKGLIRVVLRIAPGGSSWRVKTSTFAKRPRNTKTVVPQGQSAQWPKSRLVYVTSPSLPPLGSSRNITLPAVIASAAPSSSVCHRRSTSKRRLISLLHSALRWLPIASFIGSAPMLVMTQTASCSQRSVRPCEALAEGAEKRLKQLLEEESQHSS